MTYTERIVRALLNVVNGEASAYYKDKDGQHHRFRQVSVIIRDRKDTLDLNFYRRNDLTKLDFAKHVINGVPIHKEDLIREKWIPPSEFTHWHKVMLPTWISATDDDIAGEIEFQFKQSKARRDAGMPLEERAVRSFELYEAYDRLQIWQPFAYLTDSQQTAFEAAIQPAIDSDKP